jgi:predicted methyltransferase
MRKLMVAAGLSTALLAGCAGVASPVGPNSAHIAAAVADIARPEADRARDAARKPAEVLAFAEVRPGQTVLDAVPGGGYFTRLFAGAVGPTGKVIAYVPTEIADKFNSRATADALAAAHPNVEAATDPLTQRASAPFADVVFTAQNYHDFHTPLFGSPAISEVNAAVASVLKPGGLLVIIDHSAQPGSGLRDVNTLHRIDKEQVKREVTAAGFVFEGESRMLANPADPMTANVFDPGIRGRTDQFVLKFRKPRR